ncbi:TPA: ATP-binding protein [Burkholderia cepacia ATCC 25416]|uniref:AlbA family DNA-binding domain-containing protein n=1 Tax=Burkholderia cepacia TaxID=292 RepID=UPI000F5EC5F2|nr:ATP-binding protein [Burkholderia cepacia]HDR9767116.1 ATP-binding protein [Burkholderia cepacia ATCC 25416]MCA8027459.1 ATP-binding protein [Burkholderia cepacia]MCA8075484.1 ATP-binding protein [Burkholderia cepacia]RRA21243.1 ATP-binding protein [Burkholderia cepacia]HDR9774287.1 ATP-binding protein [Burkholderia cepacia ATCC 25416]
MLHQTDLRDVTFADLQALKDNQIPESHTLDFKRDFPLEKDGRASLAADVVAFANTRGGDLILGADEEGGVISSFVPIELQDVDAALRSLQSTLTDLIEPKISGVHLEAVGVPDGGYIVIVRTPPSFQAPHRVRKSGAFYTRTSTGIDPMDITTLRNAFLRGETAVEKIRGFRAERIEGMFQRPLPARLERYTIGVLHVVPMASILAGLSFDMSELYAVAQTLPPPSHDSGHSTRINLDGPLTISTAANELYSYTQLFRNGSIESVMRIQWDVGGVAWVSGMEKVLVNEHHHALKEAFLKLGIDGPAVVMLSFTDIGSVSLEGAGTRAAVTSGRIATIPAYYQNLLLPELVVESFATSSVDIYGPLFDMVWNAAGRTARPLLER